MARDYTSAINILTFSRMGPDNALKCHFVGELFSLTFDLLVDILLLVPVTIIYTLVDLRSPNDPVCARRHINGNKGAVGVFGLHDVITSTNSIRGCLDPRRLRR